MIKVAITGSINTGKTTVCYMLKKHYGVSVFNFDDEFKKIINTKKVISIIRNIFPNYIKDNKICLNLIKNELINKTKQFHYFEQIVHNFLFLQEDYFFIKNNYYNKKIVFSEIPLLFETNQQKRYDFIILTHCPEYLQKIRSNYYSNLFFQSIKQRQINSFIKMKKVNAVIFTGINKNFTKKSLYKILNKI